MLQQLLALRSFRWSLALLSGLLMVLSFPYTGSIFPLAFIAWIPLLMLELTYENRRSYVLFLQAYLAFLVYNIGTTWWIYYADESGAYMAFICNSLLMAIVFYIFHRLNKKLGRKWTFPLLASVWIGFEFFHFNWEVSWPWLTLGNTFARVPEIVQWYSITGVMGGSLWILAVNYFLFRQLNGPRGKSPFGPFRIALLLLTAPILVSVIIYATYSETKKPFQIVLLQPNVDPYFEKFNNSDGDQLDKMMQLAAKSVGESTQLVMAPETALFPTGQILESDLKYPHHFGKIYENRKSWGDASFLAGATTVKLFDRKNSRASKKDPSGPGYYEYYNSSLLFPANQKVSVVHKSKLVLGVEKIPFSNVFPWLEELSINLGGSSGTLGIEDKGPAVMKIGKTAFAPVVCYESIYGDFVRQQCGKGAEFIAIITNDGWWRDTPGYKQHFAFARLRAIENRRYIARSANTGKSGFINQRGDVLQESGWWTETSLKGTVQLNKSATFYQFTGDLIGYLAAIGFLFFLGMRFLVRRSDAKKP